MEFCLERVGKIYTAGGTAVAALADVTASVQKGEFVALIGPSGCGKSTLLHLAAGLLEPSSGRLFWRGAEAEPRTAMVFQESGLFPWLTVRENVAFGIEESGLERGEIAARVTEKLELVGLTEFADAYPGSLSGGMKQRVGIARALVCEPDLFLLDEPFSALDARTGRILTQELARYWALLRPATLYVTHRIEEAVRLADRLWIFSPRPGRLLAIRRPSSPRSDRLIGALPAADAALVAEIRAMLDAEAPEGIR